MAEEKTQKPAAEEVVVVADVPEPEKPPISAEKELPPAPEPEPISEKPAADVPASGEEQEKPKAEEEKKEKIIKSYSFKEESNVVEELPELQKKALDELKSLIQEALNKHEFNAPPPPKDEEKPPVVEEVKEGEEANPQEEKEIPPPEAPPAAPVEPHKPEPEAPLPSQPPVEEKVEEKVTTFLQQQPYWSLGAY